MSEDQRLAEPVAQAALASGDSTGDGTGKGAVLASNPRAPDGGVQAPAPEFRLLILDWDGTVRDSIGSIIGCAAAALASCGLSADEGLIRGTVGLSIEESARRWSPKSTDSVLVAVLQAYRSLWIDDWHARSQVFEGVETALDRLQSAGHWLTVATGKSRVGLERDFALVGVRMRSRFVETRTADETRPKPHPAMVLELLEVLGVEAREALVVGDSVHDLSMARNAGCAAVGVRHGASLDEELLEFGPLALLDSLNQLPDWLEARQNGA